MPTTISAGRWRNSASAMKPHARTSADWRSIRTTAACGTTSRYLAGGRNPVEDRRPRLSLVAERKRTGEAPILHWRPSCSELPSVLRFPIHRGANAISSARVIEEDPLFDRAGTHLPILREMNRRLREAVGLAAGVDAVHVRFALGGAGHRVEHRREDEEEDRAHEHDKRKNGGVAESADAPARAPARQRPVERPTQRPEPDEDHDRVLEQTFVDVIEHVVSNLVSHHGLHFFGRRAANDIVVER